MPSLLTLQTFPNGSFEDGLNSWVVLNQRIRLGGLDRVAGFPTPIDPTTAPRGGLEAIGFDPPRLNLFRYFTPAPVSGQAYSTEVSPEGRAVMLSEVDAVQNNPTGVGAVVHGPVIHNAFPVRILQGTTVQFDWEASGGGDAFDVFGYIIESNTGASQVILDSTGKDAASTQALTTNKFTTTATGDYYFVFVSGTWDASNGRYAGARLSIDNILISPFGYTFGGDSVGDTISITLSFDGPVSGLVGTTSSGIFLVNGIPVNAVWSGTDGGTVRVLTYTITKGDLGQATIDENALNNVLINGVSGFQNVGPIKDLDTNITLLPYVDGVLPTIVITASTTTLKPGGTATLTFTLSEASTDFTAADVAVSGGTLSGFSGAGTSYTAFFTLNASVSNGAVSVASNQFSDAVGNFNDDGADANNSVTMTVDTIRPLIAVSTNKTTLIAGETATLNFTLSEASTDFTAADVAVSGGTLSGFSGTGTNYTAIFTLNASGTDGAVIVAANMFSDAAGNFNADGAEADNSVAFAGAKLWGTSRNDYARALATGPDGSIYMAGETEGDFAGLSALGMRDIFLSKMNADGTTVWTKLANTRLADYDPHLAVANDGSVYMSATSNGNLNRAGNSGSFDAYLLKYDANGNMLWTARQGTSTTDRSYSVATDSTGAAYLVGQTQGRLDGQRSSGNYDGFITKYSAQGTKLWTKLVGTSGIDVIKDVATDASGFVYVTGSVSSTLAGQTRIGMTDAFITKYASDGTVVWTKVFGTKTTDYAESIGLGSDGSIYVAGQTLGSMNGASSGNYDVFLTKFSAAGAQLWSRQFGSGKADNALDLVVGSSGGVTLTGHLGVSGTSGLSLVDAFTASFDANGTRTAYEVFGTGSNDYGTAVTEGLDGVLYMAGYTLGSAMLGRPSNGAADAYFFARANQTTLTSASATAAASATRDVFTFGAGSYNATITGGFAYGDKLVFPSSMTNLSVSNTSPTDGQILITASGSGQQIQVTLTGVALGLDGAVTTLESFWASFGPPGT